MFALKWLKFSEWILCKLYSYHGTDQYCRDEELVFIGLS